VRVGGVFFAAIVAVALSGCVASWSKQRPGPAWTNGFWVWESTDVNPDDFDQAIDVLFVQAGSIERVDPRSVRALGKRPGDWRVWGALPRHLPAAKEYWLVFRCENQAVPDAASARTLAGTVSNVIGDARAEHMNVAGVQLDVDSPTHALPQYAGYLREFRKELPQGLELSITALLDWFREGTPVAQVIREVDEFVPQFYDIDASAYGREATIAGRLDAAQWGPVFNRFGKRYRIGISTFGRSRFVPRTAASTGWFGPSMFRDVVPLDIAANAGFRLETARNRANELVLRYRATKRIQTGSSKFEEGDAVEFILATPDSVRAAVKAARQMRGNVAGVVFFRWPGSGEALTMEPGEVLAAAGVQGVSRRENRIAIIDGRCAAVACADVYLEGPAPFSPKALRYRIRSSEELEYFLPEKNMPVRMAAPSELEVALPPYCARGRLYIGRAVTVKPAEFHVEEEP